MKSLSNGATILRKWLEYDRTVKGCRHGDGGSDDDDDEIMVING